MSYRTKPLPPGTPEKVDRVRYLVGVLARAEYRGYETIEELADQWGLSTKTVRDDVAEAGRWLKLSPEEIEGAKQMMAQAFLKMSQDALSHCNNVTGLPDYRSAMECMVKYGIYSGIADKVEAAAGGSGTGEPVKIEVTLAPPKAKEPEPKK